MALTLFQTRERLMAISRSWVVKGRVLNGMFREGMFAESGGLEMLR